MNTFEHLDAGDRPLLRVAGQPATSGQDPIVGVIDFNGRGLHMAEQGDLGLIEAELIGPHRMRAVYVESGDNAVVFRVELTRTNP